MFVTAPDRLPDPKLCRFWILESQERPSGGRNKHVKFGTHPKAIAHAARIIDLGNYDLPALVVNGQMT